MRQMVWSTLLSCHQCLQFNYPTTPVGQPLQLLATSQPKELLSLDFYGPLPPSRGFRYVLLGMDHFSKFAFARMTRRATANIAATFLKDVAAQVGPFKNSLSDSGTQFTSHKFVNTALKLGISHHHTGAAHFEGNGSLERLVRSLACIQAKAVTHPQDWSHTLQQSILAYNSTPHAAIHMDCPGAVFFQTPWTTQPDLLHGSQPPPPAAISDLRHHAHGHRAAISRAHRSSSWTPFHLGDLVLHVPRLPTEHKHYAERRFRVRKFGPFQIVKILPRNHFLVSTKNALVFSLPGHELSKTTLSPPGVARV
jgi:hypothetical protein